MGIFRQFPYTNFHDLNLDYILRNIRDLEKQWADFVVNWGKEVAAEVDNWLTAHPEATTTVQDHSISEVKLTEDLAIKTIKDYYTPQMFGAKGDGVTDDTAAFKACAHLKYVIIPNGNYVINERVTLDNVLGDFGTYTDYAPLFKKELGVNIKDVAFGKNIELPINGTYCECAVSINEVYYLVCRNPAGNIPYIATYDKDLNMLSSLTLSNVYGNANSCHTDGENIYIDFDTGYHVSLQADLTNEISVYNTAYRHIIPYNKTWYAVWFEADGVVVAVLSGYNGGVVESHKIPSENITLQSASIIDGILYIPTVDEDKPFRFIDIATYTMLNESPYMSLQEIESFFKDTVDDQVKVVGHFYGFNGIANIGTFKGVDYYPIKYVPIDGSIGTYFVLSNYRYNIYRVENGLTDNFPFDDCDIISLKNGIFAISNTDNKILTYINGNWEIVGTLKPDRSVVSLTIGGVSVDGTLEFCTGDGYFTVDSGGSAFATFASGDVIGTCPEKYRPDTRTVYMTGIAWTTNNPANADAYPVQLGIKANGEIVLYGNTANVQTCTWISIL